MIHFKNHIVFKRISSEKKRIIENISSLSLVQVTNYILLFITMAYLVRVLGPEKYGLVAFAQALIQYFIVITDYGFLHTAPKKVAVHRDDKEKLFQIFNSIMIIKFILLIISFIILLTLVFTIPKFRSDWNIYLATFLMVVGNILFPIWFFQGIEKMKYITYLNILSKLIFTILIFVFIKVQSDYIYVPIINSSGLIIAGVLSLWIIVKDFKVKIFFPSKNSIYEELKESWSVFLGMSAVSLYSTSNIFILGIFTNNTIVGYFKAGDTFIRALVGLLSPLSQATYPYVSRMVNISKKKVAKFVKKLLVIIGGSTFVLGLMIFFFAQNIVNIIFGHQYMSSVIVVQILSPLPFLIGLSSALTVLGLLAFNMNKTFSSIVALTGVINIMLALILCPVYKHIGISISLLIAEMFATIAVFFCSRHSIFIGTSPQNN